MSRLPTCHGASKLEQVHVATLAAVASWFYISSPIALGPPSAVANALVGTNLLRSVIAGASIKEAVLEELAKTDGASDDVATAHAALAKVVANVDSGIPYATAAAT